MSRFYFKHDPNTNILTLEITPGIAVTALSIFCKELPIEMDSASLKVLDMVSESGQIYKDVFQYKTKVMPDKMDIFFDAAKKMLAESIKNSNVNSDN